MSFEIDIRDIKKFTSSAHEYANLSAEIILPYFRSEIKISNKSDKKFDPVTAADRNAEKEIRNAIKRDWPTHGILGEEFGYSKGLEDYCWILDPIDGTSSFVTGLPVWGTLIGLLREKQTVLGIMNQPFIDERFWSNGKVVKYEGPSGAQNISTRPCKQIDHAVLSTTSPDLFKSGTEAETFDKLKREVRSTRYGMDCYAYCLLAAGHIDLVLEAGLKAHDIAPLIPIVETAGGRVSCWKGGPAIEGGRILASGDPYLHDQVLSFLNH